MNKVNVKCFGQEYTNCYLIGDTKAYGEYLLELNNKFELAENEIHNRADGNFIGHGISHFAGIAEFLGSMGGDKELEKILLANKVLQARVISDQLTEILNGNKILINKNGGYFPIKPGREYEVEDLGKIIYAEDDIHVKKWSGGSHYYAKVGKIDVIDDNGGVKWNTYDRAHEVAFEYMKMLNNRN